MDNLSKKLTQIICHNPILGMFLMFIMGVMPELVASQIHVTNAWGTPTVYVYIAYGFVGSIGALIFGVVGVIHDIQQIADNSEAVL